MEHYNRHLVISARILLATVFLLNGFGVMNQTIPAKEMLERGVPPAIVPLPMIGGRAVEVIAGFGLAVGVFPRLSALALAMRHCPTRLRGAFSNDCPYRDSL